MSLVTIIIGAAALTTVAGVGSWLWRMLFGAPAHINRDNSNSHGGQPW